MTVSVMRSCALWGLSPPRRRRRRPPRTSPAQISDRQTTIASAVEERTATTSEMSRSVQEAASDTGEIATNITGAGVPCRAVVHSTLSCQARREDL
jgi:hypothetical protein